MMGAEMIIGRIVLLFIILLAIPVGGIFLQIYLSKMEDVWPGLILPAITFALSLMVVFSMAAYVEFGTLSHSEYVNGEWVTTIVSEGGGREVIPGAVGGAIYTFLLMNIPTAILLIIYKSQRSKRKRLREVDKMSVHDL